MVSSEIIFPLGERMFDAMLMNANTTMDPVTNSTETASSHKGYFHRADFTVYAGFVLTVLLFIGLIAYISFVIRVTVRDNRRRKRLAEMGVTYNSEQEKIGVPNLAYSSIGDRDLPPRYPDNALRFGGVKRPSMQYDVRL